jgi:hypothetical protein
MVQYNPHFPWYLDEIVLFVQGTPIVESIFTWHKVPKITVTSITYTDIMFLDITHRPFFIKKQRFGDWILSPSSGKTYSVGLNR